MFKSAKRLYLRAFHLFFVMMCVLLFRTFTVNENPISFGKFLFSLIFSSNVLFFITLCFVSLYSELFFIREPIVFILCSLFVRYWKKTFFSFKSFVRLFGRFFSVEDFFRQLLDIFLRKSFFSRLFIQWPVFRSEYKIYFYRLFRSIAWLDSKLSQKRISSVYVTLLQLKNLFFSQTIGSVDGNVFRFLWFNSSFMSSFAMTVLSLNMIYYLSLEKHENDFFINTFLWGLTDIFIIGFLLPFLLL